MARRWFFALLVVGSLWIAADHFAEMDQVLEGLSHGRWHWLLAALGAQASHCLARAMLYRSALQAVGQAARLRELLPLTLALFPASLLGMHEAALFVEDAEKRGDCTKRAAAALLLVFVADLGAILAMIVVAIGYFSHHPELRSFEMVGMILLILVIGALSTAFLLGRWQPEQLRQLLGAAQGLVGQTCSRLRWRAPFHDEWAEQSAGECAQAACAILDRPMRFGGTLAWAGAAHLLDMFSLYFVFQVFAYPVGPGALLAGYDISTLLGILPITPHGIGVTESVLALVYQTLGVPKATCTLAALTFRALNFWLPLSVGIVALRRVKAVCEAPESGAEAQRETSPEPN